MIFEIFLILFTLVTLTSFHELGHFILAKKFGVKVEEFGIGYPPRLIGKKIGETIYSFNLLPFGAFIRVEGEDKKESEISLKSKKKWQRALIYLGGVLSFWVLSVILLSIVFNLGVFEAVPDDYQSSDSVVRIVSVKKNAPAQKAGIKAGDIIEKITVGEEQFSFNKTKEIQQFIDLHKGEKIVITVRRGKNHLRVAVVPCLSPPEGEGPLGIGLVRTITVKYPWYKALLEGIKACLKTTWAIVAGIGEIIVRGLAGKGLPEGAQFVGPIGIGSLIFQSIHFGINFFLQFIAFISIYLAVFNILPIPALDGGKLLFLLIEAIRGKEMNPQTEKRITAGFFIVLLCLMAWVTFKDIVRIF